METGEATNAGDDETTVLDLTSCQLHSLESVDLPPVLTELDLTANRLSEIDPRIAVLSELKKLSLRQNLIDDAAIAPLSSWSQLSALQESVTTGINAKVKNPIGATMMNDGRHPVEKFEGMDYAYWKMQIEDYLYERDLDQILEEKKPTDMKEEEWKLLDRKAMSVIRLSLSKNVALYTTKAESTKEMLKTLSDMYEKPSAVNKVYLMRKLFNLRMAEGTMVAKHLNEFNATIAALNSVKITFEDEVQALILLSSLPDSWSGIVTAVSASTGNVTLKLNEIRNLIINEKIRRREFGLTSSSSLNASSRGRYESNKERANHGRSKSKKDMSKIQCYNCDKYGHYAVKCKAPKRKNSSANATTEDHGNALVLSVCSPLDAWILNSGASFYSCSEAGVMENYDLLKNS